MLGHIFKNLLQFSIWAYCIKLNFYGTRDQKPKKGLHPCLGNFEVTKPSKSQGGGSHYVYSPRKPVFL
jgi:hypothetical protein